MLFFPGPELVRIAVGTRAQSKHLTPLRCSFRKIWRQEVQIPGKELLLSKHEEKCDECDRIEACKRRGEDVAQREALHHARKRAARKFWSDSQQQAFHEGNDGHILVSNGDCKATLPVRRFWSLLVLILLTVTYFSFFLLFW